jgi:hypothetical protein
MEGLMEGGGVAVTADQMHGTCGTKATPSWGGHMGKCMNFKSLKV